VWMDPAMGIVGGTLVAFWAWGLVKETGAVLLDRQAPEGVIGALRDSVESDHRLRVVDLHVWSIGPGYRAAIISVQASDSCQRLDIEKLIPKDLGIAHLTIEVHPHRAILPESDANP
jgi:Co/Zn/Cd efflux system component